MKKTNTYKEINKSIKYLQRIRDNKDITGVYFDFQHINSFLISLYTLKQVMKNELNK